MSDYIKEFEFKETPKYLTYLEAKPLELNSDYIFFHNKNKFRKDLNRLQYTFKSYTNNPLMAVGIRDSYLKAEYSDDYLIVVFTTYSIIKNCNEIIEEKIGIKIEPNCFFLETTSEYMLLLAKDMKGLNLGIDIMEEILTQVMDNYLEKKNYDNYMKIRPFKLSNCPNLF